MVIFEIRFVGLKVLAHPGIKKYCADFSEYLPLEVYQTWWRFCLISFSHTQVHHHFIEYSPGIFLGITESCIRMINSRPI